MNSALRRSSRSKKSSPYHVGDMVEIKRRSRSFTGRLVYKLTEGDSPNPLWLVTFDGDNPKDEEIYEKHFGKILKKGKVRSVEKQIGAAAPSKGIAEKSSGENNNSSSSSDHEVEQTPASRTGRKAAQQSDRAVAVDGTQSLGGASNANSEKDNASHSAVSDASPPPPPQDQKSRSRVSAREQRSLRRQAKIDKAIGSNERKRGASSLSGSVRSDAAKYPRTKDADEEVVKVKLHTGTLYLYKGLNRRAEFVRRY